MTPDYPTLVASARAAREAWNASRTATQTAFVAWETALTAAGLLPRQSRPIPGKLATPSLTSIPDPFPDLTGVGRTFCAAKIDETAKKATYDAAAKELSEATIGT